MYIRGHVEEFCVCELLFVIEHQYLDLGPFSSLHECNVSLILLRPSRQHGTSCLRVVVLVVVFVIGVYGCMCVSISVCACV